MRARHSTQIDATNEDRNGEPNGRRFGSVLRARRICLPPTNTADSTLSHKCSSAKVTNKYGGRIRREVTKAIVGVVTRCNDTQQNCVLF